MLSSQMIFQQLSYPHGKTLTAHSPADCLPSCPSDRKGQLPAATAVVTSRGIEDFMTNFEEGVKAVKTEAQLKDEPRTNEWAER